MNKPQISVRITDELLVSLKMRHEKFQKDLKVKVSFNSFIITLLEK